MPGDGLALTVGVCCEVELIALLQLGLEVRDLLLLIGAHHIQRGEVILRVHAEARPGFLLILSRHVRSAAGKIADMAHGGLHDVVISEVRLNLLRLRRRLDDHQGLSRPGCFCHFDFIPFDDANNKVCTLSAIAPSVHS